MKGNCHVRSCNLLCPSSWNGSDERPHLVFKDVTEVPSAVLAGDLRPLHTKRILQQQEQLRHTYKSQRVGFYEALIEQSAEVSLTST